MKKMKGIFTLLLIFLSNSYVLLAQNFIHPGGLHTIEDLERMKTRVAENITPWIEGWNQLIADPDAQNIYKASPFANMGVNRQKASRDAHAAYLNTIRWYISGDYSFADCAISICNAWSSTVDQVPAGRDIPGLIGIPAFEFALVGELLRVSDRWEKGDFDRFKKMLLEYLYPICHDFLVNHNDSCISYYWANWDACNIGAIMAIGVLCDDRAKFEEAVTYYKNGDGMGSIKNAVCYMHPDNLGQWQESGRDQEHAQLGVGILGAVCQVAWNQGIDLFAYDNNRLLAGAEYVAGYNLMKTVPYKTYNNCQPANNKWPAANGRGRLDDRPLWEMLYNHYVIRQGLNAPDVTLMAQLMRPEHGSKDHFGYGTLTFTLEASDYPPLTIPKAPKKLVSLHGIDKVFLKWEPSEGNTAQGYRIQRSVKIEGPYVTIANSSESTITEYTDQKVSNDSSYYYTVAAINQSGISDNSPVAEATPVTMRPLPADWNRIDIGDGKTGSTEYAEVCGNTFIAKGYGKQIGGREDNFAFTYKEVSGNVTITARILSCQEHPLKSGLMIRENFSPDSKTVSMTVGDLGRRFARMGIRTHTGDIMEYSLGNTYTWLPSWFRIQRSGETYTAYESPDGINWFVTGNAEIKMSNSCYVGLVVCSDNENNTNVTTFDNVSIVFD